MKLYAHRGNIDGRNPGLENTLPYLNEALAAGYGVEVDVRIKGFIEKFILGHEIESNQQFVNTEFLRNDRVLTHAKDVYTFIALSK